MNNFSSVKRHFIDLSVALDNEVTADPPGAGPNIQYLQHKDTVKTVCQFFPGLAPEDLPDGEGWAIEQISLSTHNGTHLDAPWHFASTMNRGRSIKCRWNGVSNRELNLISGIFRMVTWLPLRISRPN